MIELPRGYTLNHLKSPNYQLTSKNKHMKELESFKGGLLDKGLSCNCHISAYLHSGQYYVGVITFMQIIVRDDHFER